MRTEVSVSAEIDKFLSLDRQLRFAAATSLTATAKEAQDSSIKAIQSTFTTRGKWYLPGNRFGVRIKAARKDDLTAEVKTAADWLNLHETAGTKTPRGRSIAVPTENVRRTKRQLISRSQRPRNLKRGFVIQTRSGPVLFQRKNRREIVALYNLEPRGRIRKQSTVVEPTMKVFARRFGLNFGIAFQKALDTAKPGGGVAAEDHLIGFSK